MKSLVSTPKFMLATLMTLCMIAKQVYGCSSGVYSNYNLCAGEYCSWYSSCTCAYKKCSNRSYCSYTYYCNYGDYGYVGWGSIVGYTIGSICFCVIITVVMVLRMKRIR